MPPTPTRIEVVNGKDAEGNEMSDGEDEDDVVSDDDEEDLDDDEDEDEDDEDVPLGDFSTVGNHGVA